jgi:sulfur carrier protein
MVGVGGAPWAGPPPTAIDKVSNAYAMMPQCMRIILNGETREVMQGCTVATLLSELALQDDRVAVELNFTIVERGVFASATLHEDDRVEIIGFIGGGEE